MLPPSHVQIKRKATDDPVEILRVHDEVAAGRSSGAYVFKRQRMIKPLPTSTPPAPVYQSPRPPTVQVSQPGDEQRAHLKIRVFGQAKPAGQIRQKVTAAAASGQRVIAEPRRFHMSRTGGTDITTKAKGSSIAIFHERRASPTGKTTSGSSDTLASILVPVSADSTSPQSAQAPAQLRHSRGKPSVTQIKLTPVSAVTPRKDSPAPMAPLRGVKMENGRTIPLNASREQLDREMQAHILAQISNNLAENTPQKLNDSGVQLNGSQKRYTPKSTARYRDRHPEVAAAKEEQGIPEAERTMGDDEMDVDMEDGEYIVETYIRVPVEQLGIGAQQHSVGLLVLEGQEEADEFYGGESESDSDMYDEEEDENAESHPRTEYPDEEVASDDEFGVNPYQYRNRNASDNEEYGTDDAQFSDEEMGRKEPWMKNKWSEAYGGAGHRGKKLPVSAFDSDGEDEDDCFGADRPGRGLY